MIAQLDWMIEKLEEDKIEYEFWYDDKGRVVGKVPLTDVVGYNEEYGYDDLDEELQTTSR